MNDEQKEFFELLNKHDWFFAFSDDHSVWKRGNNNEAELKKISVDCELKTKMLGTFSQWRTETIQVGDHTKAPAKPTIEDFLPMTKVMCMAEIDKLFSDIRGGTLFVAMSAPEQFDVEYASHKFTGWVVFMKHTKKDLLIALTIYYADDGTVSDYDICFHTASTFKADEPVPSYLGGDYVSELELARKSLRKLIKNS